MEIRSWVDPIVRDIDELPEGWGNCMLGSTQSGTSCHNGQRTGGSHSCGVGGTQLKCGTGSSGN